MKKNRKELKDIFIYLKSPFTYNELNDLLGFDKISMQDVDTIIKCGDNLVIQYLNKDWCDEYLYSSWNEMMEFLWDQNIIYSETTNEFGWKILTEFEIK